MNQELFDKLMEQSPSQHPPEWQMFLEICDTHLRKHKIKCPIVVELGVWKGRQKQFYEQLFEAEYIGIDASSKRAVVDIHGNTHKPETLAKLKKRLNGRSINILFIDASHRYADVKKDYEMYSPLCSNIVAFHDIELARYQNVKRLSVWKFWDELKEEDSEFLFLSINSKRKKTYQMGIGIMIKR